MHPIAFHMDLPLLGPLTVGWYGLLNLLGVVMALVVARTELRRLGMLSPRQTTDAVVITAAASLVCGHLAFLLTPGAPTAGLRSGSVLFGAIFGGVLTVALIARYHGMSPLRFLDAAAPAGVMPPLFGRLGCLMAGCCYGRPTDLPFAVTFTASAAPAPKHVPLHPTQLYEFALLLGLFGLLMWRRTRKAFAGELVLLYLGVYSAGRFVIEFFRGDEIRGLLRGGVSLSQVVAAITMLVCVSLYALVRIRAARVPV